MVSSRPSSRVLSATPSPTLSTPSARPSPLSTLSTLSSARAVSHPAVSCLLIQLLTLLLRYPLRFRWLGVSFSSLHGFHDCSTGRIIHPAGQDRYQSSSMGFRDGKCVKSLSYFGVNADVQSYRQGSLWEMQCNDTTLILNIFATQLLCSCAFVIL